MREQEIIRRYFTFSAVIGDDAAVLTPPPGKLVMSTDTLNAGVHFFADAAPYTLARKAAAVSLSDIAAMGAAPLWLTIALSAPPATAGDWFAAFADGLKSSSAEHNYTLAGGDLTRAEQLAVTTTAVGVCRHAPCLRSAARPGDVVWLSGAVGAAAHALGARQGRLPAAADMADAERRLHDPAPRLRLASALAGRIHAMMDISDGLLISAQTIAEQSGVGVTLDAAALPLPPSLTALPPPDRQRCQLAGGDDYELLFTAPAAATPQIQALAAPEAPLTPVGAVTAGGGAQVQGALIDLTDGGYSHDFLG